MKIFTFFSLLLVFSFAQAQQGGNKVDAQGKKQGEWKKFYENSSSIRYVGTFKDDKPVGKFYYYYESGQIQSVMIHRKDGSSYCEMYHQTGNLMAKGVYIDEERDSTWYFFDDRGTLSYQESYKNGKLHGQQVVYYEPVNGEYRVMESTYWRNGLKHGEHKEYFPNTRLRCESNYVDGNLNGARKYYYTSGKLERIERYKYATRHGIWNYYGEDGKQLGLIIYWEGKLLEGEAKEKKLQELKEKGTSQ